MPHKSLRFGTVQNTAKVPQAQIYTIVRFFCYQNGADVQLVDHEGFNAAYYAKIAKSPECVQLLQSAGCHVHPMLRR